MPDYRPFNASNKPDTCLWCGNKLRHRQISKDMTVGEAKAQGYKVADLFARGGDDAKASVVVGHEERGGDYADGHFCGLRCGYRFGVAMANNGRRFEPKEPAP